MPIKHNRFSKASAGARGCRKSISLLSILAGSALAATAHAAVFDFSFDDGADSGNGQFIATGGPARYTVIAINGSVDGSIITGLSGYGSADQQLFEPAPYVDHAGIAFATTSGLDYNLFTTSGADELCASNIYPSCGGADGIPTLFNVTAAGGVPEPTTWALLLVGFGGVGGALRTIGRRPLSAAPPA